MDMLITDALVVTCDKARRMLERGAVAVRGNRIAAVGVTADLEREHPDLQRVRAGETEVVSGLGDLGFFLNFPLIAAFGEAFEQDVAFDRYGDGSSALQWTRSRISSGR